MRRDLIGANAGTVWRTLREKHEKMTFGELLMVTGMNPIDLAAAIGWLSREDKVYFSDVKGEDYISAYQEFYY